MNVEEFKKKIQKKILGFGFIKDLWNQIKVA